MIAQVIVGYESKQVDKLYDYLLPEELENKVSVGSRVIVPFGIGNRQREAYVCKLSDKTGVKKLKSVISVTDDGRFFDEKMLKLINWMRERYLCTFYDIIRSVIPAGVSIKPEEWIVLKNTEAKLRSENQKKIVQMLSDNGGACEINYLMQSFETNIRTVISNMCENGIVEREYRDNSRVKDKTVRVASLAVDYDDAKHAMEMLHKRNAYSQVKILDILLANECISLSDITKFADCGYSAIASLEKKGLISFKDVTVLREPLENRTFKKTVPPKLNEEQQYAADVIKSSINSEEYKGILLYGVTGSGKTEVFMNAIAEVIKKGKQAILLVPEISLTPQMVNRFLGRFGKRVAVFHSGLSLGEKYDQWKKMRDGEADIAIGARSAVFAPFDNIGIIIMDEEHEQTYKSEMLPRYHTREVARFRAEQYGAVMLLASATPDIGSYYKALNEDYTMLTLKKRANAGSMPEVSVVDMREELEAGNKSIFSQKLYDEIKTNLENNEQTILFLNRRGFSTFVSCRSCGYVAKCPECNISLTYHKFNDTLRCHYCGHTRKNPVVCPSCNSKYIRYFGGGTQKVEEEIKKLFPEASTIRMDVDTTGKKDAHEKILNEFEEKHIDILIGTQMVAKGLDFEDVTLVGVISADVMLNLDDFRAGERSFSILEQVTGRAGRAKKPGRAVVQTYSPGHTAITCMQNHDYTEFYENEILFRKAMFYPPYCEMVAILFSGVSETVVPQAARFFLKGLQKTKTLSQKVTILGPIPSAVSKIKNKYRWQIVVKCENSDGLNVILEETREACMKHNSYKNVTIVIDKNPNGVI